MELRLKPAVKQLWLGALRSGDFPQCRGKLTDGIGYCCLGVLSELAHREGMVDREEEPYVGDVRVEYGGQVNYLAKDVADWAFEPFDAFTTNFENPRVKDPRSETDVNYAGPTTTLSELNDEGYNFEEIADVIEEQF